MIKNEEQYLKALNELEEYESKGENLKLSEELTKLRTHDEEALKEFWTNIGKDRKLLEEYFIWVKELKGRNSIQYAKEKGVELLYFKGELVE